MRFVFSLIAVVAAVLAVPRPPIRALSLNRDPEIAPPIPNGLPLLSPQAYRRRTKADTTRRTASSHLPLVNTKCNVLVKNTSNGTTIGFISPTWNVWGEYGIVQPDAAGALEVSFSYSPESSDSLAQLDILATNGPGASYPFFGATVGYTSTSDDLAVGSYNYAYITGTTQIPAGPPEGADNNSFGGTTGIPKAAESAIWTYNPKTQDITAQWINTDGSAPATHLVYANGANKTSSFVLTGDVKPFQSFYGGSYPPVTFTCVFPS